MDELKENAARRLIESYAEERDEERRRVLYDFVRTALVSQGATLPDGLRLGADLLVYGARQWSGVGDAEHAAHLAWTDAIQSDLAALFVERGASYPQVLLALAHFQATVARALRDPDDSAGQAGAESAPEGLDR
jgi:hypothetical protein